MGKAGRLIPNEPNRRQIAGPDEKNKDAGGRRGVSSQEECTNRASDRHPQGRAAAGGSVGATSGAEIERDPAGRRPYTLHLVVRAAAHSTRYSLPGLPGQTKRANPWKDKSPYCYSKERARR